MEDRSLGFLKDEYILLQNMYEDFDRRSLQIKGWMTAATVAAFALGFDAGKNKDGTVWVVVAALALCIWYLEARWKMFQGALRDRIRILEAHFRNEPDIIEKNPFPFQIHNWWFRSSKYDLPIYPYEKTTRPRPLTWRVVRAMGQDFVCLPYLPIIAIALYAYFRPG